MTPNIDGKVTNVKKSAKFHHSHWRFFASSSKLQHGQARFSLSFRPSNAKKWALFLPSGLEQHTLNLACCERRTKKTRESMLPCSAAWQASWLNNFTAQISFVRSKLAFSLAEMRPYRLNLIFISGLMQFNFPAENWSIMRPGPYIYALYNMRILC